MNKKHYIGVVFKRAPPTADFTASEQIALPGRHTRDEAWAAVRNALREGNYIGGEVRPFAENRAEKDAEICYEFAS